MHCLPEEAMHLASFPGLHSSFYGDNPIAPRGELHFSGVRPRKLAERALHGQALAIEVDSNALGDGNWRLPNARLLGFDSEHALRQLLLDLARGSGIVDERLPLKAASES